MESTNQSALTQPIRQKLLNRYTKQTTHWRQLLVSAMDDAEYYHQGQYRKSGEPTIIHPYRVALMVSDANIGLDAVIASLLHDAIEDTELTKEQVAEKYGVLLADIIDGLTKSSSPSPKRSLDTYRKLLNSSTKDLRTLQIKIFDRLDNMRDLKYLPRKSQRKIARETISIYIPTAIRMGMSLISSELQDLSFRYLYPKRYNKLQQELKLLRQHDKHKLNGILNEVRDKLTSLSDTQESFEFKQVGDYIFNHQGIDNVLEAIKICVPTTADCYQALALLHTSYRVYPNSIADYISNPKPNRYKGLRTKVFIGGDIVKLKIFSAEMNKINENGILADWKERRESLLHYYHAYIELMRQLPDDQGLRMNDVLRYGEIDSMQVFTPKGMVISLPQKSTVLDFAFAIHTDLGLHCQGAFVKKKYLQPTDILADGAVVNIDRGTEILANTNWLDHIHTPRARLALNRHFKKQSTLQAQRAGRRLFNATFTKINQSADYVFESSDFLQALHNENLSPRKFFQNIGQRKLDLREFLIRNNIINKRQANLLESRQRYGLRDIFIGEGKYFMHIVPLNKQTVYRFAACCYPLIGDPIVACIMDEIYIVHRANCHQINNLEASEAQSSRWVTVNGNYDWGLKMVSDEQPSLVYKLGKILRNSNAHLQSITRRGTSHNRKVDMHVELPQANFSDYRKFVQKVRDIKYIVQIADDNFEYLKIN